MPVLALTDNDALYGAVIFWRAANEAGIKPDLWSRDHRGTPATPPPAAVESGETPPRSGEGSQRGPKLEELRDLRLPLPSEGGGWGGSFPLLAENNTGYANLSQLITKARLRSAKGQALVTWDDLAAHCAGLIALVRRPAGRGSAASVGRALRSGSGGSPSHARAFRAGALFYRAAAPGPARRRAAGAGFAGLGRSENLPVVATNDVHYATRDGHRLHDVLVAIRQLATLEESHHQRRGNSEAYLKSAAEMARLFADRPDALAHAGDRRPVQRHAAPWRAGSAEVPRSFFLAGGEEQSTYLRWLCQAAWSGALARSRVSAPAARWTTSCP